MIPSDELPSTSVSLEITRSNRNACRTSVFAFLIACVAIVLSTGALRYYGDIVNSVCVIRDFNATTQFSLYLRISDRSLDYLFELNGDQCVDITLNGPLYGDGDFESLSLPCDIVPQSELKSMSPPVGWTVKRWRNLLSSLHKHSNRHRARVSLNSGAIYDDLVLDTICLWII
jgi:hypothetical protein